MAEKDPRHLLVDVAKILQKIKIPYIVTGGMAVLIWGRPRFTADIDIVVELTSQDINSLSAALLALGKANYLDKDMMKDAISHGGEFNFIHGDTGIKVDFWVIKNQPFELSKIKRRVAKNILGQKVYFTSPEDLILSKLQWYKLSGSDRHIEDVKSIFKISGKKLDKKYLNYWIGKLKLRKIIKEKKIEF